MGKKTEYADGLKQLGSKTKYLKKPNKNILEVFSTPSKNSYFVTFIQKGEFTSLCPKTGQPDFANIKILYKPKEKCVESKSLKLYLFSYRQTGGFGEDITNRIADDLYKVLNPCFILVVGDFKPRGGIRWKTDAFKQGSYSLTDLDKIEIAKFLP